MNTDDELDALLSFDLDLESLIDWDSEPTPAGEYQKNGQRTRIGLDRDPAQITETPRRPEFEQLRNALESRRQIVATARNHAKLLLFKLDDGRTLAAHGSLNLRRCNSFEQLSISTDPALFDFFAAFISDAIAEAINP